MRKIKIITTLVFLCLNSSLHAFDLISEHEYMQFLGDRSDKPKKIKMRSLSSSEINLPEINVLLPIIGMKIASPTNIDVTFKAKKDSKIDIDSLKFSYGWLGLDITKRIKKNAKITVSGLSAENVTLPKGDHVITIKISDYKGRTIEREIEFTIE